MVRHVEGGGDASDLVVGVAVADWNRAITDRLLEGALRRLEELAVAEVTVVRVPGSLELPVAVRGLIESGCEAVVAIGTVIRGETDHYEIVVRESTGGVARVAAETGVPVGSAILAVSDVGQATDRALPGPGNTGHQAADAAVRTALALRRLRQADAG